MIIFFDKVATSSKCKLANNAKKMQNKLAFLRKMFVLKHTTKISGWLPFCKIINFTSLIFRLLDKVVQNTISRYHIGYNFHISASVIVIYFKQDQDYIQMHWYIVLDI